jgi:hypothetical protein
MYKLTLILGLFFLYSCNSSINKEDLQKLAIQEFKKTYNASSIDILDIKNEKSPDHLFAEGKSYENPYKKYQVVQIRMSYVGLNQKKVGYIIICRGVLKNEVVMCFCVKSLKGAESFHSALKSLQKYLYMEGVLMIDHVFKVDNRWKRLRCKCFCSAFER